MKRFVMAALLCAALVLAACGGGDDVEPTPSPTPAESTVTPTRTVADYATRMSGLVDDQVAAFENLSALTNDPDIGNPTWEHDVKRYADDVIAASEAIRSEDPPGDVYDESHRLASQACTRYIEAMELLKDGIDEQDPGKINESWHLVGEGSEYMGRAVDAMPAQ